MGGFNSGRHGGRICTGDLHALDIRQIQRAGFLKSGTSFNWRWTWGNFGKADIDIVVEDDLARLSYRTRAKDGEWHDRNCAIPITWSACHFGGRRAWWICSGAGCRRRVAVLFGGEVFACRHCQRLAYQSSRETPNDLLIRRADKLRDRLGWQPGILNGSGSKLKGQHWRTFWRLKREYDELVGLALSGMAARLGMKNGIVL